MMPRVDITPPDTSLYGGAFWEAAGSFLGLTLAACVAGLFVSAGMWALGSACSMPEWESRGKLSMLGCLIGAFITGSLWAVISWLLAQF